MGRAGAPPGAPQLLYAAYAPISLLVLLGGSPHLLGAAGRLALALAALPVRLAAAAAAVAASGLVEGASGGVRVRGPGSPPDFRPRAPPSPRKLVSLRNHSRGVTSPHNVLHNVA